MNHRQRITLAKRLPATRRELADALATLTLHKLDPFPTPRAVTIATARATGSAEAERARQLLAAMRPDPESAQHLVDLSKVIS